VIWDFNGTLINDIDPVVTSVNTQLTQRGLPAVTAEHYREVFGFPVEDYYRRLGLTFETETIADLAEGFFAEYTPKLKGCSLHEGILEALDHLAILGMRQFVLSAMEQGMLREMICHAGIDGFFEGVYGLANQEGASKITRGEELLRDFDIDPATALLIGDTDHDAEVGDALGVKTVLVATGHQAEHRLRATQARVLPNAHALLDFIPRP
jgi:phosphoglycolate phosphatase